MTVRIHLNKETGEPGVCSAQPGNCPFATDEEHFISVGDARQAFEAAMGGSFMASLGRSVSPTSPGGFTSGGPSQEEIVASLRERVKELSYLSNVTTGFAASIYQEGAALLRGYTSSREEFAEELKARGYWATASAFESGYSLRQVEDSLGVTYGSDGESFDQARRERYQGAENLLRGAQIAADETYPAMDAMRSVLAAKVYDASSVEEIAAAGLVLNLFEQAVDSPSEEKTAINKLLTMRPYSNGGKWEILDSKYFLAGYLQAKASPAGTTPKDFLQRTIEDQELMREFPATVHDQWRWSSRSGDYFDSTRYSEAASELLKKAEAAEDLGNGAEATNLRRAALFASGALTGLKAESPEAAVVFFFSRGQADADLISNSISQLIAKLG